MRYFFLSFSLEPKLQKELRDREEDFSDVLPLKASHEMYLWEHAREHDRFHSLGGEDKSARADDGDFKVVVKSGRWRDEIQILRAIYGVHLV